MSAMRSSVILVVDDEPRNARLLEALLLPQGYTVATAASGDEALRAVREQHIDLVLLDVMMPGLDGFEVTRRLRAEAATRLIPVVLVTALRETEDRVKGIEAGCDDFISKPFDKHEVVARVKTLLTLSYYRSLLDEKEKFESVVESLEEGVAVLDGHLAVTRVNARAATLLGLSPHEDIAARLTRVFTVRHTGDLRRDLLAGALAFDVERPATDATKPLILCVRSSVVRDPSGAVSAVVLTVRDVTAERAEEAQKQEFLDLISHKLRTPVAVMLENASLLRDGLLGPFDEQQRQVLDAVVRQGEKLNGIVDKLLAFTAALRQVPIAAEPLRLGETLPALVDTLAKRQTRKPLTVSVNCDGAAEAPVGVNRRDLETMLASLLDNAVKFSDKETVTVRISARRCEGWVELSVTDNGPGIPPEEHERIFTRFHQVERYFTGNVEGVGLGLPLVQRLVSAYGGTVQVRSTLGHGATFTLTLPLAAR